MERGWSGGVVEYWSGGNQRRGALKVRKKSLAGQTDSFEAVSAIGEHPSKLQYSITPILHSIPPLPILPGGDPFGLVRQPLEGSAPQELLQSLLYSA
jgi:hypothetical protein